jgi:serine/threonine protein phosphatase 1
VRNVQGLGSSAVVMPRRVRPLSMERKTASIMPERPVYLTGVLRGDIHAFGLLLQRIDEDARTEGQSGAEVIVLGDVIVGSGGVRLLESLAMGDAAAEGAVTVLMGRAERFLLDFLDDPAHHGPGWLRAGGRDVLRSIGAQIDGDVTARSLSIAAERLTQRLGPRLLEWLSARPASWTSGNVVGVHAALDPERPTARQDPHDMICGHPKFRTLPRRDGIWVVHAEPGSAGGVRRGRRIAVGGGLQQQQRVEAVRLAPGVPPRFIGSSDAPRLKVVAD